MQGVEVAQCGRRLHLRRDVRGLEAVDLVQRDDDRSPETENAPRDEAVARADVGPRVDDEQYRIDVVERRVDRLLHALGERIDRTLEAGKVDERQLVVGAVRDAEDPPARGVRDGRRDRDLLAAERVDKRGLPDVRAAGNRDETGLHVKSELSNDSGSSSSGVIVTTRPPLRNTTRSTPISCSHWRHPPHGDAVIAATTKSPGR